MPALLALEHPALVRVDGSEHPFRFKPRDANESAYLWIAVNKRRKITRGEPNRHVVQDHTAFAFS